MTSMVTLISLYSQFSILYYVVIFQNPQGPAYGIFVSQLIRYALVCSKFEDFLFRGSILVSKLLKQGYYSRKLQTTFQKFYGRHTDLVHKCDTSVSHMLNGLFTNCDIWLVSLFGGKSWRVPHVGQEMLTHSGTPDFTPFGDFMISPMNYVYIIYYWICQF